MRIGNYLQDAKGRLCRVESMGLDGGMKAPSTIGGITSLPNSPIPLTEDWLIKLGFEKREESPFEECKLPHFVKNRIFLFFNSSPPEETYLVGWGDHRFGKYSLVTGDWINSVDRLQNIYHALTGKELRIK